MERRSHWLWTVSAIGVLATGCDTELRTENRQLRIAADVFSLDNVGSARGIVEQSRLCVERTGYRTSRDDEFDFTDAEDAALQACYDERLTGPVSLDEAGCLVLDTPGDVTWDFERKPCDLPGHLEDDQVRFEVLPLSETRGAFRHSVPPATEVFGYPVETSTGYPEGYVSEVGAPVRVIEDLFDGVSTVLVRGDRPEMVAVTQPFVRGETLAGSPAFSVDVEPFTSMPMSAVAGDAFQITLTLPAGEVDVGRVDVVARTEVASMTLHPLVSRIVDTDVFLHLGATAITRDAMGRVLRDPPVHWRVIEGDLPLTNDDLDEDGVIDPKPETGISGACARVAPGEVQSVTLEARMDGFRDTVRVEWDCVGQQAEDGCACRSGGTSGRALAGPMGLLGLGLWSRRRRRR